MSEPIDAAEGKGAYKATLGELLAEAAVLISIAVLVFFFCKDTGVMSIAVGVFIAGRFVFLYRRGDLAVFVLGFVVGGGNDLLSMYKGVYYYTPPTILPVPIPVWMLFFWGEAFLFFRRLMRYGPFMGEDKPPEKLIDAPLAADAVIAVVYRFIVYRWASEPFLPDALYAAILVVRLILLPPKAHERYVMLAILALGPFYEILLIKGGLYVYQNGVVLGMPLWLVIYWVFIFRFLKAIIDRMEYFLSPSRFPYY